MDATNENPSSAPSVSSPVLTVEGFAKIHHARITWAPLMLFVGPNNTGKSFLSMLVWGLHRFVHPWLEALVVENRALRTSIYDLVAAQPDDLVQRLLELGIKLLDDRKSLIVEELLNHSVTIERLAFALPDSRSVPVLRLLPGPASSPGWRWEGNVLVIDVPADPKGINAPFIFAMLMSQFIVRHDQFPVEQELPRYLPASRSGFMLLHKIAGANAVRTFFRGGDPQHSLPDPVVEFLKWLNFMPVCDPGPYADIADELEAALRGQVKVDRAPTGAPSYVYMETGSRGPIPLSYASSLVTVLSPIILTLRYARQIPLLVVEEPEVHLDPQVLRAQARALVRLVHAGVRVLITTHSDLFCQEIDNLLKLGSLPEGRRTELQAELGYTHKDHYLLGADVRGYSFQRGPDGTDVTEMDRTPYGLVMPTFNNPLEALLRDTRRLDSAIAEVTDSQE